MDVDAVIKSDQGYNAFINEVARSRCLYPKDGEDVEIELILPPGGVERKEGYDIIFGIMEDRNPDIDMTADIGQDPLNRPRFFCWSIKGWCVWNTIAISSQLQHQAKEITQSMVDASIAWLARGCTHFPLRCKPQRSSSMVWRRHAFGSQRGILDILHVKYCQSWLDHWFTFSWSC